ncbi:pentatricopeptide repeat-containing protein At2g03380, mitochondrial-like [Phalaenopsis equestris]|uniref:pentatricopeptide repeat-containing protein At2g03380, mitochondrial-like n=1 Tax=Phalaenopsis equestris TaxID=78828 RepID=UPI0009E4FCC1|nr:pentatricopeptide repeat-containing protein At2g03380, mitochondrial-like [Phalaenopsis equestris]
MASFLPALQRRFLSIPSAKSDALGCLSGINHQNTGSFLPPPLNLRTCSTDYSRTLSRKILSLFDSCTNLFSLRKSHTLLIINGLSTNLSLQTKLLVSYAALGNTKCARMLFDRITDPDLYSCKAMMKSYLMNDCYLDAIKLYGCYREFLLVQDNVLFSLVLNACVKLFDLNEGKKIHCHIAKVGNPDDFLLNTLIDMYAKCGDLNSASTLFDTILEKNVVTWTTIMSGLVQHDRAEDGLILFNSMRLAGVEPSEYTMGTILSACSSLEALVQGRWIQGYVLKKGMAMNIFIGSALLDMYVKCGEVTDAYSIFNDLDYIDLITWTAMVVGYTQNGYAVEALKLFSNPNWADIIPNSITIASALSASAQLSNLNLGRSIHMLGIKLGVEDYNVVMNAIVDMYAKCGSIKEAENIFQRMDWKDLVTWNAMMAGYSQNNFGSEALLLFHKMRFEGYLPDAVTIVNAFSTCASICSLYIGGSFHAYAVRAAFLSNIYVSTALLNFYNKCGDLTSARQVFDEMCNKNVVTWCAMMGGYGLQGDSVTSLDLFQKMLWEDLKPNEVTFMSILSTCGHTGMVKEGKELFERMCKQYEVVPSMKHYCCMVDMLVRAGKLEEAVEFMEGMPVNAEISVWAVLLHGCSLHSRLDLGEKALRKIMEMTPNSPDYYVLLSNLYASDQRWDEALKVRELMKQKRLIKSPGSSFIRTDGR